MRRTLFLALTLLMVMGAVLTSAPRSEAASCGWRCVCGTAVCVCPGGPPACGLPRPECPQVAC